MTSKKILFFSLTSFCIASYFLFGPETQINTSRSQGNTIRFEEDDEFFIENVNVSSVHNHTFEPPEILGAFDEYLFTGVGYTGWNPPDSGIAVSETRIVTAVNGGVRIFSKDTNSDTQPVQIASSALNTFSQQSGFIYDPRVVFDEESQRFIVVMAKGTSAPSFIVILVSKDSSPSTVTSFDWTAYAHNVDEGTGWCDYPTLGVDKYNIYTSCNMFTVQSGNFPVMLFVFNKDDVYSNTNSKRTWKMPLRDGSTNVFSVQPAVGKGSESVMYFVARRSTTSLTLFKIIDPETSPSLSASRVTVPFANSVTDVEQPGGVFVDTGDTRMMNAMYRNGRVYCTFHHTSSSSSSVVSSVFEINPLTNSLVYSEEFKNSGDSSFFFPCVSANDRGKIALLTHEASDSRYITISLGVKLPDENSLSEPIRIYEEEGGTRNGRYGDYSSCAIDPNGSRFWVQGIIPVNNRWETLIFSFDLEEGSGEVCDPICVNGFCSENTCFCPSNFVGETCNECAENYFSSECLECPNCGELDDRGNCNDGISGDGSCICTEDWSGEFCSEEICEPACVNGECSDGLCICEEGWTGVSCSVRLCDPICVNGDCQDGICVCDPGFSGDDCSDILCESECLNGGSCNLSSGTCFCQSGFSGEDCSEVLCQPECVNGDCQDGTCVCDPRWLGEDCGTESSCPFDCVNGECIEELGFCKCETGFCSETCTTDLVCNPSCKNNGFCDVSLGECVCISGYTGQDCSSLVCNPVCKNEGTCDLTTGTCDCEPGYSGEDCSEVLCNSECLNGGNCDLTSGTCLCQSGFSGEDCSEVLCSSECLNGGSCETTTGTCVCQSGYSGEDCSEVLCVPECNSFGGTCDFTTGTCECNENACGVSCENVECVECNRLTGNCNTLTGICECKPSYSGTTCENSDCECNLDGGLCEDGSCVCYNSYKGDTCSEYNCGEECQDGVCQKIGGEGEYTKVMCVCNEGSYGEFCEHSENTCTN